MYNYLGLTNDLLIRMNEVPLANNNFGSATGFHADAKGYINASLNRINIEQFEWPFNHKRETLTAVAGVGRYTYPVDAKTVAFDSFLLHGDLDKNIRTTRLRVLDYEEYLDKYSDHEVYPAEHAGTPEFVVRNRDLSFTVVPAPNQDCVISYEYYTFPKDLEDWDSTPTVPEHFRWVILEGALYHAYAFRGGVEEASICDAKFTKGVGQMRTLFVNRTEYARSTMRLK